MIKNKGEMTWVVWNERGRSPTVKHPDYGAAVKEAKRLARENPGQSFTVLVAVLSFHTVDLIETAHLPNNVMVELDDEIPF